MKYIHTSKAPDPAGHYSQAIVSGSSVFVSGQLPIDPDSGEIKPSIEDQTSQVLSAFSSGGRSSFKMLKL